MPKLSDADIEAQLKDIPDWTRDGDFIERQFKFKNFQEAMAFIVRVGFIAEDHGHHPDLYNVYNRVTLKFTTHDAGGLTDNDFNIAKAIDKLAKG